jgi:UPF0271 protein
VAIGAHPGFPERESFGRRQMDLSAAAIYDVVTYQVAALQGFLNRSGPGLQHVKAHGTLYDVTASRPDAAEALVRAARDVAGPTVIMVGGAASEIEVAARRLGLKFAAEIFADRNYGEDCRPLPPPHPEAQDDLDDEEVATRGVAMVRQQAVRTVGGHAIPHAAHTLCIHDGHSGSLARAAAIRMALERADIRVAPLRAWL